MTAPTDNHEEFLTAVAALREGSTGVRTTAHTSSVSADDWPVSTREPETQDPETDLATPQ